MVTSRQHCSANWRLPVVLTSRQHCSTDWRLPVVLTSHQHCSANCVQQIYRLIGHACLALSGVLDHMHWYKHVLCFKVFRYRTWCHRCIQLSWQAVTMLGEAGHQMTVHVYCRLSCQALTLLSEAAYNLQVVASQLGLVHVLGGRLGLHSPCAHYSRNDMKDPTTYCTFHFTTISQCPQCSSMPLSVLGVTQCSQCYPVLSASLCVQAN